uniref:Uncharacterized protein n=1 Tax=Lepeophtheirus salmonis TaxID=72036 RepID=A0A0K2U9M9_LEPSM
MFLAKHSCASFEVCAGSPSRCENYIFIRIVGLPYSKRFSSKAVT